MGGPKPKAVIKRKAAENWELLEPFWLATKEIRRILNRHEGWKPYVDDALQDSMVRILKTQPKDVINHKGYLYTITRNILAERAKDYQPVHVGHGMVWNDMAQKYAEQFTDPAMGLEEKLDWERRIEKVIEVLNSLTPKARGCYMMHRFEGCVYWEIALEFDISVSMVKKYLHIAEGAIAVRAGVQKIKRKNPNTYRLRFRNEAKSAQPGGPRPTLDREGEKGATAIHHRASQGRGG